MPRLDRHIGRAGLNALDQRHVALLAVPLERLDCRRRLVSTVVELDEAQHFVRIERGAGAAQEIISDQLPLEFNALQAAECIVQIIFRLHFQCLFRVGKNPNNKSHCYASPSI